MKVEKLLEEVKEVQINNKLEFDQALEIVKSSKVLSSLDNLNKKIDDLIHVIKTK